LISGRGAESIDPGVCNNERVENSQKNKMAAVKNVGGSEQNRSVIAIGVLQMNTVGVLQLLNFRRKLKLN